MRDGEGIHVVWEGQVRSDCNEECDKREREGLREREREQIFTSSGSQIHFAYYLDWKGEIIANFLPHTHTHTHTHTHSHTHKF